MVKYFDLPSKVNQVINRKEVNDEDSIQHHNLNTTSRKPKTQVLSQKLAKRLPKMIIS